MKAVTGPRTAAMQHVMRVLSVNCGAVYNPPVQQETKANTVWRLTSHNHTVPVVGWDKNICKQQQKK